MVHLLPTEVLDFTHVPSSLKIHMLVGTHPAMYRLVYLSQLGCDYIYVRTCNAMVVPDLENGWSSRSFTSRSKLGILMGTG